MREPKQFAMYISIFIVFAVIVYGVGDYLSWWDHLRGRHHVMEAWKRLAYTRGGERILIFDDEACFPALIKIISDHSHNDSIAILHNNGIMPSAVARMGGTLRPDMGDIPEGWPDFRFALETSPVICLYDYTRSMARERRGCSREQIQLAGTLGELREYITQSRNTERFWIQTLFIEFLSVAAILLNIKKPSKSHV